MIVLHAAPMSWTKTAGHNIAVPGLVAAQNRIRGVRPCLVSTLSERRETPAVDFPLFSRRQLLSARGVFGLPAPFDKPDLVVLHGLYIPSYVRIAATARKAGVPYLVCPHGSMTQQAQAHRAWKKRIGNLLVFNRLVAGAAALHCLNPRESAEVARLWKRPTFVAGNGIEIPDARYLAKPGNSSRLRIVFVGRLAERHKGLDLLLEACWIIRRDLRRRGASVELYGPDHRGDARSLGLRVKRLGLEDMVTINGPIVDDAKRRLLSESDVFLHTSRWEGHPMAVLEALAYGLPCLVTDATNLADEASTAGAAWQVEATQASIARGLVKVLHMERHKLQTAGVAARRLAEQQFDWDRVAARTVDEYWKCLASIADGDTKQREADGRAPTSTGSRRAA